jgi:hypothetical protein
MASTSMMLEWKSEGRAEGWAEGMASGMLEARREDLLKTLRVKYQELPPELNAAVRGTSELNQLTRWFDAALAAPTIDSFAALVRHM